MPFARYRSIIPEWEAFEASRYVPEPVTIRVRRGKISSEELLPRLMRQGFHLTEVPGVPDFFRVESGPGSIAQTLEYWLGYFHIQQAVMALPSLALSPRPGERVLDLCAAPGGKTAHMAELMEDRGPLVAVDPKEKRLRALLANIYRLGHSNVLVIASDGRQVSLSAQFDRVLVDAPCSAEGTFRRQEGKVPKRSPSFVAHITRAQEALLRRGIALTRPGGSILYSTCTFAPEENEAIVSRVLEDSRVAIEPIPLDLPHSPGLIEWQGERFHHTLEHAWRIYPHQMNAGGLFMVLLRKLPEEAGEQLRNYSTIGPVSGRLDQITPSHTDHPVDDPRNTGWEPVPQAFPGEELSAAQQRVADTLIELESFFGFPSLAGQGIGWMVRNENVWAQTAGEWPIPGWEIDQDASRWRVVSMGLRAFRDRGSGEAPAATPSSFFLSRWGHHLGPARQIHLSVGDLRELLEVRTLPTEVAPGAVVLLWDGAILGRGMVRVGGELVSEIPRAQRARLRSILGKGESP